MTRRFIDGLTDGESIEEIYLVAEKQVRSNRNGNPYLHLELRDRSGSMPARFWNASEHLQRAFEPGDFTHVKAKVQLHQGGLQMIVSQIERVAPERLELTDFLPHTEQDVNKLLERVRGFVRKIGQPHLRALCDAFLIDEQFVRGFLQVPAGIRVHHAYIGGLLEHVATMMELADRIAPLYPGLDRDLLMVGVLLHDAGKVRELAWGRVFGYTDEGQLIGHLTIGVEMVNEKLAEVADLVGEPFPRELLYRVKHLILSHHGALEFGSPKVPMTPEALALHHLDALDSKLHMFLREIREDRNPEAAWTQFNPTLQRRVYKGGSGSTSSSTASPEEFD